MIKEWDIKKQWLKHNKSSWVTKILVILDVIKSPTLEWGKAMGVFKEENDDEC